MRFNHSLKIEHSMVVEVLSCIRALALQNDHLEIEEALNSIEVSSLGSKVLSTIQKTPEFSYGFHEFLLINTEREDIRCFF